MYEKGGSEISFERAIALAKYYNVSLDYLAGLTDVKINSSVNPVSESRQGLIHEIDSLTDDEKRLLYNLLQKLIQALK